MGGVKPEEAIDRTRALRAEAATLPHATSSTEFNSWKPRVRSLLTRPLGEHHHITERFVNTKWTPSMYTLGDTSAFSATFRATIPEVQGILDAAIAEIELLADEAPVADESGVDAELWEHIAPELQAEAWGKVASQAVIFTEDRIRKWAGRPVGEVGKGLGGRHLRKVGAVPDGPDRGRDAGLAALRPGHRAGSAERGRPPHPGPP